MTGLASSVSQAGCSEKGTPFRVPFFRCRLVVVLRQVVTEAGPEHVVGTFWSETDAGPDVAIKPSVLYALAQPAIVEAVRLESVEAPQKEAEAAEKLAADSLAQQEKSRLANKASFRP